MQPPTLQATVWCDDSDRNIDNPAVIVNISHFSLTAPNMWANLTWSNLHIVTSAVSS